MKTTITASLVINFILVSTVLEDAFPGFGSPLFWIGQSLVIAGAAFDLAHYRILKKRLANLETPNELVTDAGAFRYIRHPMYLGESVVNLGFLVLAPNCFSAVTWTLFLLVIIRLSKFEDRRMSDFFGDHFSEWARQTQLLLPKP